jgi:hypothetical protein
MNEHRFSHSLFRSGAHAVHARLFDALSQLAHTESATEQGKAWQALEASLLAHLRDEEDLVLPDFGLLHSDDAAHVRGQHERIRQCVARMSVTASAGGLDLNTLDELSALLRDCARFEERLLYPWAERQLRASKKGEFLQRAGTTTTHGIT